MEAWIEKCPFIDFFAEGTAAVKCTPAYAIFVSIADANCSHSCRTKDVESSNFWKRARVGLRRVCVYVNDTDRDDNTSSVVLLKTSAIFQSCSALIV